MKIINNMGIYKWDTYLGNKRMKNLSFFTIAKSKVKNIVSVGVCK